VLLTATLSLVTPVTSGAQTTEELVAQRRLELRAAREASEAARAAFEVVDRQFRAALQEVTRARASGDSGRLDRASALAQDRSVPRSDAERRLKETGDAVVRARDALIEALEGRMAQLVRDMDAAGSTQQRAQLNTLFMDAQAELESLEAEAQDTFRFEQVVFPEITFDPRDGPDEMRAKAEVLERQAVETDTLIASKQDEIRQLTDRLRIQRAARDFMAGTGRFDDTRVPVVAGSPTGNRPAVTDSTVAGARPMSLEERIQALQDYVRQLENFRDQLRIRAREFRARIGAIA